MDAVKQINNKKKNRILKILIIIMIIIIILLLVTMCRLSSLYADKNTAVIETSVMEDRNDNMDTTRIIINPDVIVKNGVMQNLEFTNLNENRSLECIIKIGDKEIYKSNKIKTGETLKGDYIDVSLLNPDENEAVAEIRSYNSKNENLSQTNVKIKIHYIS